MTTLGEERARLRHELHAVLKDGEKTIQEALTVPYDHKHRIRQRWLAWWSNFFLLLAGSKFRARIIKSGGVGHE